MFDTLKNFFTNIVSESAIRGFGLTDLLEVLILAYVIYHFIIWIRRTQAWILLKGIILLLLFVFAAYLLNLNVILWIFEHSMNILFTAVIVVFQPELRKALDSLGRRNPLTRLLTFDEDKAKAEKFSNRSIAEIVKATMEMAKAKTGALIVFEQDTPLNEYERTGIRLDSAISSQLLINIFEHNTPLHDGAVILRNDRVMAATCYLPLSDNMELSKAYGTRHRAAVGLSEVTDSVIVVVSEETGRISVAQNGKLDTNLTAEALKERLTAAQQKKSDSKKRRFFKGRSKE